MSCTSRGQGALQTSLARRSALPPNSTPADFNENERTAGPLLCAGPELLMKGDVGTANGFNPLFASGQILTA